MMDYYSNFNMPSLQERKIDLLTYANSLKNIIEYTSVEIDIIVNKIVNETNDMSLTGYAVFGKTQERQKLENIINKTNSTNNTCTLNTFK